MEELRNYITQIYDGSFWEEVTGMQKDGNGTFFQLLKFEKDVEFENKKYRCLIISKYEYNDEDINIVEYNQDIFENYTEL